MAERPILFGDPMVRTIISGTKTQTRRPIRVGGAPVHHERTEGTWRRLRDGWAYCVENDVRGALVQCPFGEPGGTLWVRECWATEDPSKPWEHVAYRADGVYGALGSDGVFYRHGWLIDRMPSDAIGACCSLSKFGGKWRPSIHMPRWASRLTLRVTDIRVQRLHDITEVEAIAEGVTPAPFCKSGRAAGLEHVETFEDLWTSVYGTWNENPWVWAVSFERMEGAA